jgi:outer membrane biosynthesis protein TonB
VPVVGSRFLIEAGFIIAVAVIAGIERLSTWWIIAVVAGAWLIVAAVEIVVWARQVAARQPRALEDREPVGLSWPNPEHAYASRPEPPSEPDPVAVPAAEVEPEAEPEPEPEREPEPAPAPEPPRIRAVPTPPEPQPAAEPEPVEETLPAVAFLPVNDTPREWNLWELERAAREHTTDDVARNEERAYLLMYLREFAGPDGVLPSDFDSLVRDAFGDLLPTVA